MDDKQLTNDTDLLDAKAEELMLLLRKGGMDADRMKAIQQKVINAFDAASLPKKIEAFKEIDTNQDRLQLLNSFEYLLSQHQLDSNVTKKFITRERLKKMVVVIIGVIMITLGMAMIIMPAPPYFEMFTVFYFNPNDGVTIMDIISLLIVFTGIYLFLSTVIKKPGA
ncbi:hypothetical protein [Mucilaginibacter psychrotolerans]|uniref:Uncharacterized protein n=1 Tax=Mucilaginibacter psychrotolerans TaxID=1524096 RepID=A0A4Y8SKU8_9SPHI|nr:hypothetical protein [Mucilaginibacter psychrotolerans]TFF39568.1 hypothetical protein E2R66_04125 [Mucilaginibacter psychrotolerans]